MNLEESSIQTGLVGHHKGYVYTFPGGGLIALRKLRIKIEKARSENVYALGEFVDFEGAFN